MTHTGTISQIIGVVVDATFEDGLPNLFSALTTTTANGQNVVLEVQQHIGSNTVRTIAMGSTDGLARGQEVTDTGKPISVPVGPETLGRMFNVVGETIDHKGALQTKKQYPILRAAPEFKQQ